MYIDTLKFRLVALPCGTINRLYTTNLFRGGCPHSCAYCYASGFKGYASGRPEPVSMEAIKNVKRWPKKLFLCSASDPFHPEVIVRAEELLRRALATGVFIVISTKALVTAKIVDLLSRYPEKVSYTVSLSSLNYSRNSFLETHAPTANERLYGNDKLFGIKQITARGIHVTLKADTLFPGLDDDDQNISMLLVKAKDCGVEAVTFSYAFYRNKFKRKLASIPIIQDSLSNMSEYQPIASGKGFSLALDEKWKRLVRMAQIANEIGFQVISTCKCKNHIESVPKDVPLQLDCHFHAKWF